MNFHSQTTWRELDAWVNTFGIPAMTAIRAATYWPAVFHSVADRVGTIEPGKLADIILIDGNPTLNIYEMLKTKVVLKEGKVVVDKR